MYQCMNKLIFAGAFLSLICLRGEAQEALWSGNTRTISPQINEDRSVTFRYFGPCGTDVFVTGDFLPREKVTGDDGNTYELPGKAKMERDTISGGWVYTSVPLEPELYLYNFVIDSITTLDPMNIYVNRDIKSFTNRLLIPGEKTLNYDVSAIPHGTVLKMWYDSPSLGLQRRLSVYTPPGYENTERAYPVLYLLHGMGGDENAWLENGRLAQIMDHLIADNQIEPMIVVMPNGNPRMSVSPADGSLFESAPDMKDYQVVDGTFENSFPEIVSFVDERFRTIPSKQSRALAGLSMGGFHTMTISKEFPDLFDYVGLFSAATYRALGREGFLNNDVPEIYSNYDRKINKQFAEKPSLYWIGIGKGDFLYDSNSEYRSFLDKGGYDYEYHESEGGHTWRNWRDYLTLFARKLFKQ